MVSLHKCYVVYSDLSEKELISNVDYLLKNPSASYNSFYANFMFWTKAITPIPRRGPRAKGFYIGNTFVDPISNNFYLNRIDELSLSLNDPAYNLSFANIVIKPPQYDIDVSEVHGWKYTDLNINAVNFYIDLFKKLVMLQ